MVLGFLEIWNRVYMITSTTNCLHQKSTNSQSSLMVAYHLLTKTDHVVVIRWNFDPTRDSSQWKYLELFQNNVSSGPHKMKTVRGMTTEAS